MDKEKFEKIKREMWDNVNYDSKFRSEKGQIEDKLEKIAINKGLGGRLYEKALDVGIGNGRLIEVYSRYISSLTAVDISIIQLKKAKKRAEELGIEIETYLCSDASKLDIQDESYDLVICTRVLQHVHDWRKAISEFRRILKQGGDLFLLTYNRFSIYGLKKLYENKFINPLKGRFRNPIDLIRELKRNGFRIDYYSGALIGQPELYSDNPSKMSKKIIFVLEKLCQKPIIKYIGGRQVVRAKKV